MSALSAGTRLNNGAFLIEEILADGNRNLRYRAFDVEAGCEIEIVEFFPPASKREASAVVTPPGWTQRGKAIAFENFKKEFAEKQGEFFKENNTLYFAERAAPSPLSTQSTAPRQLVFGAHQHESQPEQLPQSTPSNAPRRVSFAWCDLWPDALQGFWQGALAGAGGGVLLGGTAAFAGEGDVVIGVLRGLWAMPIGALAGALLGVLRALPSNAAHLATASAKTTAQRWQSTLSGAAKGALLGGAMGCALLALSAVGSGEVLTLTNALKAAILFALSGAMGGGIVGFIRVMPRDRRRK